ncbi:beta-lactamase-like protein [Achaetomium macrosporum]|uniref:Beta-lactamase-like protein n=1 Tax=Achaetomium macrosporum TaxID=79813 RepID=A0AAN7HGA9_9PEZI|nr:beta-lactamase-like protein [Achaetomium macrosporum]
MSESARHGVPAPSLGIPASPHTVDVSIINTTSSLRGVPTRMPIDSPVKGHDWMACPIFAFLIQHPTLHRSLLFDLGIRKDWANLSPVLLAQFKASTITMHVEREVRDILDDAGVEADSIEAIVLSHWHFDHIGDPNRFASNIPLIVGPGFKEKMLPVYPVSPQSPLLESDFANRELIELDFSESSGSSVSNSKHKYKPLSIGRFPALDYFGDGSFYLLDSPGHTFGHLSALAGVGPSSFVFLGGDAFHHVALIRPSQYLPLPDTITTDPFAPAAADCHSSSCPGALFDALLSESGRPACGPFYQPAVQPPFHADVDALRRTQEKVQELDAHENILVAGAQDESLLDFLDKADMFPRGKMNAFEEKGWVRLVCWRFLRDFAKAVGRDVEGETREWGPVAEPGRVEA